MREASPSTATRHAWSRRGSIIAASILLPAALLLPHAQARADLYAYVDDQGQRHFASEKVDERYSLYSRGPSPAFTVILRKQSPRKMAKLLSRKGRAKVEAALASRQPYGALVARAALKEGVDQALVHAVIEAESGYDPRAVSARGAVGLMQLMPATARQYGAANRGDPAQNIAAGTRYLSFLLSRFKGNLSLAVAAYNAGEGNVSKYGNAVPPFTETKNYVAKVMNFYRRHLRV